MRARLASHSRPQRRRIPSAVLALVVLALATLALLTAPAAGRPGDDRPRTATYEVRTLGEVSQGRAAFARHVRSTLEHPRGWAQGGTLRWRRVTDGGDVVVWLA
ncbi:MAG: hypothetical protein ACRDU8_09395, partial [Egibacteraceae bacterium]